MVKRREGGNAGDGCEVRSTAAANRTTRRANSPILGRYGMLAYGILTAATGRGAMDNQRAALRAEALRQLRWQQGEWARILATHPPGTPCRIAAIERARISDSLVLLQEAGEDIPKSLLPCGSR